MNPIPHFDSFAPKHRLLHSHPDAMAAMALTFSVASVTAKTYDVMVKGEDRVKELRD